VLLEVDRDRAGSLTLLPGPIVNAKDPWHR
jgi:hypothetical protein